MGFIGFAALLRTKRSLIGYSRVSLRDSCSVNHLFFCPEQYRQTEELSIFFLFDENPGVAFCWLGRRSSRRARAVFRSHRSLQLRPSGRRWLAFPLILSSAMRVSK